MQGTTSTCPAGEICGTAGAQETIRIALPPVATEPPPDPASPTANYFVEVHPFSGPPNGGQGGTFTLEFSDSYTDQAVGPDPDLCVFSANAGPDQNVIDVDDDGDELVFLDGSASIGATSHVWTTPAVAIPDGETTSAVFPVGVHTVTLTISDGTHIGQDSLEVVVTDLTPNIPPETDDTSAMGDEDAVSIPIVLSGSDVDGVVASFALSNLPNPIHGILYEDSGLSSPALAGTDYAASTNQRTIYFVPEAGWFGVTAFVYAARDDSGADDPTPATATITVNEIVPLGGTVSGVSTQFVVCFNRTTGLSAPIVLLGATSWDCASAGLQSQPGDLIDMLVRGTDQ